MNCPEKCLHYSEREETGICAMRFYRICLLNNAQNYDDPKIAQALLKHVKKINKHASALGKLGGKSKSASKQASSAANLKVARALRWPKKGGL
jgi:hypothetical protein